MADKTEEESIEELKDLSVDVFGNALVHAEKAAACSTNPEGCSSHAKAAMKLFRLHKILEAHLRKARRLL